MGMTGMGSPGVPTLNVSRRGTGSVAVTNAATGTIVAGALRDADPTSYPTTPPYVDSIPLKLVGLSFSNTTAGALTVTLYQCPTGIAANGVGAVQKTAALTVAAGGVLHYLTDGAVVHLPPGVQWLAVASNTGIVAEGSWEQER